LYVSDSFDAALSALRGLLWEASTGNLVVAAGRIRAVSPSGVIESIAGTEDGFGGDDGPALEARISVPWWLAQAQEGAIYFVDTNNYRVRKLVGQASAGLPSASPRQAN
jgi:hypothetical protein